MRYAIKVLVYAVLAGIFGATLLMAFGTKAPWWMNAVATGIISALGYVAVDGVKLLFKRMEP